MGFWGMLAVTLKFSIKPPLPSEAPRTPSEADAGANDESPIMHWERVKSSVFKLSRSDERVRSFTGDKMMQENAYFRSKSKRS